MATYVAPISAIDSAPLMTSRRVRRPPGLAIVRMTNHSPRTPGLTPDGQPPE
ncbi:hypothetical protein AERO9AM_30208 [Aeromicrobium sp. 9AM]|nr:hypothetical protein AERO9AM_30208 [Aeromicrobium sp. 9AM]